MEVELVKVDVVVGVVKLFNVLVAAVSGDVAGTVGSVSLGTGIIEIGMDTIGSSLTRLRNSVSDGHARRQSILLYASLPFPERACRT